MKFYLDEDSRMEDYERRMGNRDGRLHYHEHRLGDRGRYADDREPGIDYREACGDCCNPCGCDCDPRGNDREPRADEREWHRVDDPASHVHAFSGDVRIARTREDPHNHFFVGMSEQAIPIPGGGHVHRIRTRTDFYEDHLHPIDATSGPAIMVGDDRHIHFSLGSTLVANGHDHEFRFSSAINDPIGE